MFKTDFPKSLSELDISIEEYDTLQFLQVWPNQDPHEPIIIARKQAADYWFGMNSLPVHNFAEIAKILNVSAPTAKAYVRWIIESILEWCEYKQSWEYQYKFNPGYIQEANNALIRYCNHIKLIDQYKQVVHQIQRLDQKHDIRSIS